MLSSMYVCVPCACEVPSEVKDLIIFIGTAVMDICESSCGCWKSNQCPYDLSYTEMGTCVLRVLSGIYF